MLSSLFNLQQILAQNPIFASTTIQIGKVEEWDWWDELLNKEDQETNSDKPDPVVILVLPTHAGGAWPVGADDLQRALQELQHDWRIEQAPLRKTGLQVATFGMGSSAYDDATMGRPAKEAWQQFSCARGQNDWCWPELAMMLSVTMQRLLFTSGC